MPAVLAFLAMGSCFLALAEEELDNTITMEDQIYLLLEAKLQCEQNLTVPVQEERAGEECFPEWDGLICWPRGSAGKTLAVPCPSYIYDFNHQGMAFRHCNSNGTWAYVLSLNRTWSNYSECLHFLQTEINLRKRKFFERLSVMYTVGYSTSFSSLTVAIFIISYFRATSIFIKDKVVHPHFGDKDFDSLLKSDLQNINQTPGMDRSQYVWCKITVVMFIYFLATNYYWILVEGLYLHSLIFVAFFSETKYLWGFILIGWGRRHQQSRIMQYFRTKVRTLLADLVSVLSKIKDYFFCLDLEFYCVIGFPAVFVAAWAAVRATMADTRCWELNAGNIKWIYQTPILVAIGLNFVLFLNTVRVLATKIWETNAVGYDVRKQYRKLAKSTLILIFVFGVHYIVFVCLPHTFTGLGWEIRMHCELFFNSFQGFFVSIIYCYCNGEVQAELKKTWAKWHLAMDWKRTVPCGNSHCGSVLTNVTQSTSSHAQMGASSRMRLVSSKACRNGPGQNNAHINLPGYVRSNSEHDCIPQWAQEEADEEEEKRLDGISLNKPSRLQNNHACFLEEEANQVEIEASL